MIIQKVSIKEVNHFLLCGILICVTLYFGREVLIPLTFSIFFAMLFTPLCNRMERHRIKRWLSALISVLIIVVVTAGIAWLVYLQGKQLADQFSQIEQKAMSFKQSAQQYISENLHVSEEKQKQVMEDQMSSAKGSGGRLAKKVVGGLFGILGASVIVLIFTFLFLVQRNKYESFFLQLMSDTPNDEARKVINKISKVAQSYLTGRVISILIFTALFTVGFLIVGLEGAFLLAFMAALLTIVPYVGSIIGGLFPFAVALVTGDTNTAIGALTVVIVVQAVDNYFIEPYVIGGEVHISALFTILILLIGGLIWGVAGMVLFLPMLGVTRIVFDHLPGLKPYAYLIGDQENEKQSSKLFKKIKGLFGGKEKK